MRKFTAYVGEVDVSRLRGWGTKIRKPVDWAPLKIWHWIVNSGDRDAFYLIKIIEKCVCLVRR